MLGAMKICHYCWTEFPTADLETHQAAAHPGMTRRWRMEGKTRALTIIDADGNETELSGNDVSSQYRRIRAYRKTGAPSPARAPSVAPDDDAGGAVDSPASSIRDNDPTSRLGSVHRIRQMSPPTSLVSRGVVEAAFTREFLASNIQECSRILSEWDGACIQGTFSATEAAQIATLLYDPTVSVIIDRFGGKVDRFKMMLAAAIILGGRGRYHVRAIGAKAKERTDAARARKATPIETPEREAMTAPVETATIEPADSDYWSDQFHRQNPNARHAN